ncbi:MAG TPA: radical SAM protein, partial [Longimicrobiaceae bacterium]|nr:radical SAM protein [Longimicrobiaceae bacterium]
MKPTIEMTVSPYDRAPSVSSGTPLVQLQHKPKQRWVPSRFNARTVGADNRLILWNTMSGAMSVFRTEDHAGVIAALSHKGVHAPLDKYGRYLSRRGFLVRDDVNEMELFRFRYAKQHWRSDVLQLILLASEDCNFRCVYCYEKFKRGTMEPGVRQGVRELVLQRAPHLKQMGIWWFGGEPLYGWEAIEELGPFFRSMVDRYGLGFNHQMTTNAYLLTEERATKLLEWGCNNYQITIDGLPEEHDCKRVGRDGSPTHGVILDNLRSMRDRDAEYKINIRINYDRQNFLKLGAFMEALSEDFAHDPRFVLRFHSVGKWGGDNDSNLDTCGLDEQRWVRDELRRKAEEVNLHAEGGIQSKAAMGSQVCYAGRPFNFVVGATGKLMKCTVALDDNEENVVGQL